MAKFALPAWPLILFGVLEPAALIWAYYVALTEPQQYFADQVPHADLAKLAFTPQALSLTLQLGNVLLLLAALALVCCWTPHAEVTRWYLIAVALADLGHIYASYRGLGDDIFWDVRKWNGMVAGNIGASAFLHVNRWATVAGLFGMLGPAPRSAQKRE